MPRRIDRTGQRFGRLLYVKFIGVNKFSKPLYECLCDCGKITITQWGTNSCGCYQKDRASEFASRPKTIAHRQALSRTKSIKDTLHTCRRCGEEFVGTILQRFCGIPCQKAFFDSRAGHNRAVSWTLKFGAKHQSVCFWKVFERDGGICQVCKKLAPRELRGGTDPKAPTLGHIIPLARGGDHTYANTQLEHLGCNLAKGDLLPDGVVELRTNPDPRTRIEKIRDETRKAMQRPDVQEKLRAARPQTKGKRPKQSEAIKAAWARGAYEKRNTSPQQ